MPQASEARAASSSATAGDVMAGTGRAGGRWRGPTHNPTLRMAVLWRCKHLWMRGEACNWAERELPSLKYLSDRARCRAAAQAGEDLRN